MKTSRLMIVLFFICVQLMAQVSIGLKASGGGAFPLAPSTFKDNYKMGYNVGAGLTISFSEMIAIEGEADYNNFALDVNKLLASAGALNQGVTVTGGSASLLSLMANLKLYLIPKISPVTIYLFGGGGLTSLKIEDAKVSGNGVTITVTGDTESKFGIQAGAGVQFGIGMISLFIEGKYVTAFTKGDSTALLPVKVGLIFGL